MSNKIPRCPLCNNHLYPKKCGLVCKNHKCALYWKLGGWCLKNSVWVYADLGIDKIIRWDRIHPGYSYPPLKNKIDKKHLAGMYKALEKDETLCFMIPRKYCLERGKNRFNNELIRQAFIACHNYYLKDSYNPDWEDTPTEECYIINNWYEILEEKEKSYSTLGKKLENGGCRWS